MRQRSKSNWAYPDETLLSPHRAPVLALRFSGDDTLFTATRDGVLRRWDMASGAPRQKWALPGVEATAAAITPDGKTVAFARADNTITLHAETSGNLGSLIFLGGDPGAVRELYLKSLGLRRALRDRIGIAPMFFNLAEVAEREADPARAVALYVHAGRLFHELGSPFARVARRPVPRSAAHGGGRRPGRMARSRELLTANPGRLCCWVS